MEEETLSHQEIIHVVHSWDNDTVEPLEPIIEKYGWEGFSRRLEATNKKFQA